MRAILLSTILMLTTGAAARAEMTPAKQWFAPDQPLTVNVKPGGEAALVLTDFAGKVFPPKGSAEVAADKAVDVKEVFQELSTPGTYVLYLVKRDAAKDVSRTKDFIGTPLVINVRQDSRPGSPPGPMVTRVMPLKYAMMTTAHGPITMAFWFDVAPNTAENFLRLSEQGFYDGLTFHRIVPGFVIQGGDPRGDGTGSPGYRITAEFNAKPHLEGVLSMARSGDPAERGGAPPRPEFADSASSQFFICLDYNATRSLDKKYTGFGQVVAGMDTVKKVATAELADPPAGRPRERQPIEKVEVKPVTAAENPYATLFAPAGGNAERL